jgi:hypothetical protein
LDQIFYFLEPNLLPPNKNDFVYNPKIKLIEIKTYQLWHCTILLVQIHQLPLNKNRVIKINKKKFTTMPGFFLSLQILFAPPPQIAF